MFDPHACLPRGHALRASRVRARHRGLSRAGARPTVESLEPRVALSQSGAAPGLVLLSASTADSQSVTVDYSLADPSAASAPITLGVYRSADATFDGDDVPIASLQPALPVSAGVHRVTVPIPGGLPPVPARPFVVVVADPSASGASTDPGRTASFRTHVIGVVTHGGLQDKGRKQAPTWELYLARSLREQGYDAVIPFNWVSESHHPGAAVRQGHRLARKLVEKAGQFPASEPVDVHFIGHSEGTVVNSVAARDLEADPPRQVGAGYVEMTMLDPHAASNDVPGTQYSVGGLLGWIARIAIDDYQSKAKDPAPFVPDGVDDAQVFYQHSPASRADGNSKIYNLWGQVPVRGPARYFNLTAAGATHSGDNGVVVWYRRHVEPTLGDGPGFVASRTLTGGPVTAAVTALRHARSGPPVPQVRSHQPWFSGTAAPGSKVRLLGGPASDPSTLAAVGRAITGPDGVWSAHTRPLAAGRYRFLAVARRADDPNRAWRLVRPVAPLGRMDVRAGR